VGSSQQSGASAADVSEPAGGTTADTAAAGDAVTSDDYEVVAEVGGRLEIVTVDRSQVMGAAVLLDAAGTLRGAGPVVEVGIEDDQPAPAPTLGADATATDPLRGSQWAFNAVPVEPLWTCGTGTGVEVAVIDTGVDGSHPDVAGRLTTGVSTLDGATVPGAGATDSHGHGTHVAGIAAAGASDGVGIAGVAPTATIVPVKVLHPNGSGSSDDVARGIRWAVDDGADVLNLSLSSSSSSVAMTEAIDYAVAHGAVVVVAAGNGGTSGSTRYPAADDNTIAVAAIASTGTVASFSSRGWWVDVAAPGQSIISSIPGGWGTKSGTSMASPYVAGIVAATLSSRGPATHQEILTALTSTAQDRGLAGFDTEYGHGVVDPVGAHNAS
jgi:subtilisin family serine protease